MPDDIQSKLAAFGAWCASQLREYVGDGIDGSSAQDKMQALGMLVEVEVTEPCGEVCNCAEYSDFPQQCLRYAPGVAEAIAAAGEVHWSL